MNERILLRVASEDGKRGFEIFETGLCEGCIVQEIVDCIDYAGEFC